MRRGENPRTDATYLHLVSNQSWRDGLIELENRMMILNY
jgi:hypothetical protein